jgi:dihydrofolate reductase
MPKDYSMAAFFKRIDVAVMGRKTYEVGMKLGGGKISSPGMACYVFSKTLPADSPGGVTVVRETPKAFMKGMQKKKGKDIWLMGGGELTRAFLRDNLVDELYLGIVPTLIGEGISAFPAGFPQRDCKLLENKTYSKGLIGMSYEVARKKRTK